MTPKEALEKIKALFADQSEMPKQEEQPAKMEAKEYVLEGGQKILVSELEIGGMVSLVDESGNASPAPAGDHKLVDGTVITLGENGVITAIVVPEAVPVVEPVEEMRKRMTQLEQQNKELMSIIAAQGQKFADHSVDINNKVKELADIMTAMVSIPSADPIQAPKDNFSSHVQKSQKDKIADFLEFAKKIKK